MSLKFAALGSLTILSALGTSARADDQERPSLFPDTDQRRAQESRKRESGTLQALWERPPRSARRRSRLRKPPLGTAWICLVCTGLAELRALRRHCKFIHRPRLARARSADRDL